MSFPPLTANLLRYYDAALGIERTNAVVAAWQDQSVNAAILAQGAPARRPTFHASGGPDDRPYISGDGVDDVLMGGAEGISDFSAGMSLYFYARRTHTTDAYSYAVSNDDQSYAVIVADDVGAGLYELFTETPSGIGSDYTRTWPENAWALVEIIVDPDGTPHAAINGVNDPEDPGHPDTIGAIPSTAYTMESMFAFVDSSIFSAVDIALLLLYGVAHSVGERQQVREWMQTGPPPPPPVPTAVLPIIRAILLAAFPAETVALHFEPPSPAAVVTLYAPGGPTATPRFDGTVDDDRRVQIRVRDPSAQSLQTRTEALYDYFRGIQRFPAYYMVVESQGGVFYGYPVDANGAHIASFNLLKLDG